MNVHVLPPSSERNTPLAFGSGGAGGPPRPPRPPPPPPPPPAPPAAGAPGASDSVAPPPNPPRPRCGPPSAAVPPPVPALAPTSTCAYTIFGFALYTDIAMRPYIPSFALGQPAPSSLVHVSPPSVVFHSALFELPPLNPHQVRRRAYDDAYTVL